MDTIITYTHTVILANGMQTTFQSAWPAHEVVGGLTFIKTESGFEHHIVKSVLSTVAAKESTMSLY